MGLAPRLPERSVPQFEQHVQVSPYGAGANDPRACRPVQVPPVLVIAAESVRCRRAPTTMLTRILLSLRHRPLYGLQLKPASEEQGSRDATIWGMSVPPSFRSADTPRRQRDHCTGKRPDGGRMMVNPIGGQCPSRCIRYGLW